MISLKPLLMDKRSAAAHDSILPATWPCITDAVTIHSRGQCLSPVTNVHLDATTW
jgi:hypothetical protein